MNFHSFERLTHFESHTPDGIKAIYYNTAIRKLGLSVIGIFFPVFIFLETQELYGVSLVVGFYGVAAYFFIQQLSKLVFVIPVAKSIVRFGYRRTLFAGNSLLLVLLLMLSFADFTVSLLVSAAIVHGVATAFYWLSFHTLFANDGVTHNLGEEVGVTKLLERFANIAGPAIGGLMLTVWGFHVLFAFSFLILLVSIVPFFFMESHEHKENFAVSDVVAWFRKKQHRNEIISVYGRFIDDKVSLIVTPLFVFLIAGSFAGQGLIETIALILGTVSVYLSGYFFDKRRSRKLFLGGIGATAFMTLVRASARSFSQLLIFDSVRKIVSPYYWISYDTLWYRKSKSKGESALVFSFVHMLMASVATFTVLSGMLLFANTNSRFWGLWILNVVGILLTSRLWKKGKRYE